jgi:cell volume regulation protein A
VFTSLLAGVYSTPFRSVVPARIPRRRHAGRRGRPGRRALRQPLLSAWVGNAALAIILLEGGLNTHMSTFRDGLRPGLALATVGVVITAAIVAMVAMRRCNSTGAGPCSSARSWGRPTPPQSFSVLRHAGLRLHDRVSATLEIESGLTIRWRCSSCSRWSPRSGTTRAGP